MSQMKKTPKIEKEVRNGVQDVYGYQAKKARTFTPGEINKCINEAPYSIYLVTKIIEEHINPEWTLFYYLRNKLRLCGTKLGCSEGGCGACTVMVSKYNRKLQQVVHLAVNACLAPVCSMHGFAVTTVEGIGSTKTKLHPVQERIAKAHGSQCGFCTPGIVMSMYTLLRNLPKPSMKDLEIAFQGNLCRCTGYRPIIEGYKTFTEDWEIMQNGTAFANGNGTCALGDKCCKLQNGCNGIDRDEEEVLFKAREFTPYDPTQEPIFPPELKLYDTLDKQNLVFAGKDVTWYRPTQLKDLLELKQKYPDAKIIVGNTEVGVEVKFKHSVYPVLIQPVLISEMSEIRNMEHGIHIGASVTLQDMENALKEQIKIQCEYKTRSFVAIVNMLHYFAGKQIRNVAAVGGNIMTGSPISDLNPIFIASKTELELQSKQRGQRKVIMDENFFTGYRKSVVKEDEILVAINIPYTKENQYFYAYKQARRRDDDMAIVNSAINVTFEPKSDIINNVNFVFGGMAPTTLIAPRTRQHLIGKPWNQKTLELAYKYLIENLPLSPSAPGGMIQYRRSLTLSFFYKAFLAISEQLQTVLPHIVLDERERSAIKGFQNEVPRSSQYFQVLPSQEKINTIGQPIPHMSAFKQATGEAVYCDDIPHFSNELYMGLVFSSKTHANILSIDASDALGIEGVHAFFSAKDIPAGRNNAIGPVSNDDEVFVSKTVTCRGQILGAVIAENQIIAQKAARKVRVEYEDLNPVIITIEDAIKHKSYFTETPLKLEKGDVDKAFATAPHIIEGDCRSGAQEHFYMETNCTVAVPKKEDYEMEIFSTSQHPTALSTSIAHVLGVPQNRVITKVKRLGGGFGGKEHKSIIVALPAAFAASRLDRPVRCMLDRGEDMLISGTRHPFYIKYKTAFDREGKILGCEIYLYNNAGYSNDLSIPVMEHAMFHFENGYRIPNVRVIGYVCKTNLPSNTAFRGFGAPQAMLAGEFMIREIAEYLNKDLIEIIKLNLYREGDVTYYNQKVEYSTLQRCFEECIASSQFTIRRQEIAKYNEANRWKKRGISIVPTKYGIGISPVFLNQGGALVHVYTDGSVLLNHSGTEMGQGLHTKMIQVASRVLDIPYTKIHISETSTDKIPNTSPTAASIGADLNGMAVMYACQTIKERLEPYKQKNPKGKWEDWILAAYMARVSLSATGFYKTPDIGYNWETNSGRAFNYFTFGTACSEVEIDCLTGDHQVLRTDIVMDLGESLNPAIDIGQVEGGFMQGYGLFLLEEMVYSPNGTTLTIGPGSYKIPGFANIPIEFNVSLLKGAPNPRAVYSSKAVGEPPLFLASSILFAVREAIKSARTDAGLPPIDFKLHAPATSAKIRMACQDHLTAKLDEPKSDSFTPWNVIP